MKGFLKDLAAKSFNHVVSRQAAGLHQGLEIYNPAIHQEYTGDMDPHALQSFVDSQIASQLKSMGGTGQFQHMVPVPGSHFNEIENFGPDGEMTCDFDGSPIKMPRQQPMMQQPMMQQPMMQQPMQQRAPVQWAMQDLVSPDTSLAQPAEAMPNPAAAFSPSAVPPLPAPLPNACPCGCPDERSPQCLAAF